LAGLPRPLWIGLNDAALEGAFVWVSGEAATYRNWMPGEPNNGGGFVPDEDYVGMRGPGLSFSNAWNDTLNTDLYVGVVEIGQTVSPTNCVSAPMGLVSWWRAESNTVDSVDSNHAAPWWATRPLVRARWGRALCSMAMAMEWGLAILVTCNCRPSRSKPG
jgi:hypothetical protein